MKGSENLRHKKILFVNISGAKNNEIIFPRSFRANLFEGADRVSNFPSLVSPAEKIEFSFWEELKGYVSHHQFDYVCFVRSAGKIRKQFFEWLYSQDESRDASAFYFNSIERLTPVSSYPILKPIFSPIRFSYQDYLGPLVLVDVNTILTGVPNESVSLGDWVRMTCGTHEVSVKHVPIFAFSGKYAEPQPIEKISHELQLDTQPLVSILIPSRGRAESNSSKSALENAIFSIIQKSTYANFEIILVVDQDADKRLLLELRNIAGDKLRIVDWNYPFNFSMKMNFGFLECQGEFILFLNDDVEVVSSDWIEQMLLFAQSPGIGLVGAHLFFPNGSIQHAGQAFYRGGPSHIGMGQSGTDPGPGNAFMTPREVSGVTAACAMISRDSFIEVGGFTSLLPGNFNDVDLCLKVQALNLSIVVTPFAQLYHFESLNRDAHVHYFELDIIRRRWESKLMKDPYWPSHPYRKKRKWRPLDRLFGRGVYAGSLPLIF